MAYSDAQAYIRLRQRELEAEDQAAVAADPCPKCKARGRTIQYNRKVTPMLAFVVCHRCGHREEF